MMKYEIVQLPERKVVGLRDTTANDAPDMPQKISALWEKFMCEDTAKLLQADPGTACYGIYTNYTKEGEKGTYDVIAACQSDIVPEGFVQIRLPAGAYIKFKVNGSGMEAIAAAWQEIWSMWLPRAYGADFEEYVSPDEVYLYIGLADTCQSCGMPMREATEHGTQADGAPSKDYCCYCYQKGAFLADCSMEQMIEACLEMTPKEAIPMGKDVARVQMQEYFPTLARWRTKP